MTTDQEQPRGFLVVFEGIDGTGKTTQADLLARSVANEGHPVIRSREPTTGTYGQQLRDSASSGRRSPEQELDLFMRDRAQHVAEVLAPALAAGKVVILDRYYLSTAAYQGARGIDPEKILQANEAFAPIPDQVFLLELDPVAGRRRIHDRGDGDGDLFEGEEELHKVARAFAQLDRAYIARLDGTQSVADLHDAIIEILENNLRWPGRRRV